MNKNIANLSISITNPKKIIPPFKNAKAKKANFPLTTHNKTHIGNSPDDTGINSNPIQRFIKSFETYAFKPIVSKMEKIYNPPYHTSWFDTEGGLSVEQYVKNTLSIAKMHLNCNLGKNSTKAILVPHAGIKYSGICSASAYYQLAHRTTPIKRIILLCNMHSPPIVSAPASPISIASTSSSSFVSISSDSSLSSQSSLEKLSNSLNTNDMKNNKSKRNLKNSSKNKTTPASITSITGIYTTDYKYIKSMNPSSTTILQFDTEFINTLQGTYGIQINNNLLDTEHSFFNQLPYIETIAPDAKICPLFIHPNLFNIDMNPLGAIRHFIIQSLIPSLLLNDTVLVCTSDFAHINGHFEMKVASHIFQTIRKIDNDHLQFIYNTINGASGANGSNGANSNKSDNIKYIDELLFIKNSPTCGMTCILLFAKILHILKTTSYFQNDLYPRLSCYYTSLMREQIKLDVSNSSNFNPEKLVSPLNITNMDNASVSYVGLVISTQPYLLPSRTSNKIGLQFLLTNYEKLALLGLAKEQLYYLLYKKPIPDTLITAISSPVFQMNMGVFITLRNANAIKHNDLRGCIGTLETDNDEYTILSNIKKYSKLVATADTRFKPIQPAEYNNLKVSITLLDTLKPLSINEYFGDTFKLGVNGILINTGKNEGFFLPSVARENGFDKKTLLEELCINKIGNNSKNCFRNTKARLFYNEGIEISSL